MSKRKNRRIFHKHYAYIGLAIFVLALCLVPIFFASVSQASDLVTLVKKSSITPAARPKPTPIVQTVTRSATKSVAQPSTKSVVSTDTFANDPTWSQDFTTMPNGSLSSKIWSYDIGNGDSDNPGWGNNEDEYYTNNLSNVRVENGQLIIEAEQQSYDGFDYTSARIKTTPSLNFTYGKLDIVAELPSGVGSWPAFWMLSTNNTYTVWNSTTEQDPNNYLHDGEIDIMEATGSIPGQVTSSAQSYVYNPLNNNERIAQANIPDDTTTFHDYELQWTPTSLEFLVDGVVYHTVNKASADTTDIWPYNQPYYLILNIAMGGTEGGTESQQYPPYGIDNSSGPWEMAIKSINYYPYTGN